MSPKDLKTIQETETNMDFCCGLYNADLMVVTGPRIVVTSELLSITFEEFAAQLNGPNRLADGSRAIIELEEKSQDKSEVEETSLRQSIHDVEPAAAVPEGYEYADISGRSFDGMVFYCHPPLIVSEKRLQTGPRFVAVKLTPRLQFGGTNLEIELLRDITQRVPPQFAQNFIRLLDAENEPGSPASSLHEYTWFTMDALHPSITLFQLYRMMKHKRTIVPQAFPLELFLQMVPAVMCLHGELKIAHNDLHGGNIMVRINESSDRNPESNIFSFTFVLIDFGLGQRLTANGKLFCDGDGRALFTEVHNLVELCEDGTPVDIKWWQFKKTVDRPPRWTEHLHPPSLREAFEAFKDFAKAKTIEQGKEMSVLAEWTREMGDDKAFEHY